MAKKKLIFSLLLILLVLTIILANVIFHSQSQKLAVVFLDVGQGDAVLISQGSQQILIDGGPNGQLALEKLGKYIPFWDRNIEVIIATHPDQDHIDGLIDVMEKYDVAQVIDNGVSSDSQVYKKFKETIKNKNIKELEGRAGVKIKISDLAELEILAPDGNQPKNNPKDTNLSSIVSKLTCKEKTFFLTGDLPFEGEEALMKSGADISSKILKVAHHGSKYATSEEFLSRVSPNEAVVSVGKNNRYGHPATEALERLSSRGIKILRTDETGDIEYNL
jgi:competence protein ComEC